MQRLLASIVLLAWGIWFGGTIMLFLAVSSLFKTFADDHALAGLAASGIFRRFNTLELIMGTIVMLGTLAWRLSGPRAVSRALPMLFVLAWVALLFSAVSLTPRLEAMRVNHQTQSADFRRLHGISMLFYSAQTIFLFFAGIALNRVGRRN